MSTKNKTVDSVRSNLVKLRNILNTKPLSKKSLELAKSIFNENNSFFSATSDNDNHAKKVHVAENYFLYLRCDLEFNENPNWKILRDSCCDIESVPYYKAAFELIKLNYDSEVDLELKELCCTSYVRCLNARYLSFLNSNKDVGFFVEDDVIDKNNKYLLLNLQLLVVRTLEILIVRFNKDNERKVAHYTTINVARRLMLDKTNFRLNHTEFMNDPTEGRIFHDYLNVCIDSKKAASFMYTFLSCFTFNHNSLNQFRLYGRTNDIDCSGVSLVVDDSFFDNGKIDFEDVNLVDEGLPLFRCIYLDPDSGFLQLAKRSKFSFFQEFKAENFDSINKKWLSYSKKMEKYEEFISKILKDLKSISSKVNLNDAYIAETFHLIIQPLNFLFKNFSFQEEQECRIICLSLINDGNVKYDYSFNSAYIEYPKKIKFSLKNVYIGVASSDLVTPLRREIQKNSKDEYPCVRVSDNPYRVKKRIEKLDEITKE